MSEHDLTLVEIILKADVKVIKETLNRIGIANSKTKVLFPSCYLYKNFGKYYICHFKELFVLTRENSYNNLSEEDIKRKNSIVFLLKNWGLVDVVDENLIENRNVSVFVLPFSEKKEWKIEHKFNTSILEID